MLLFITFLNLDVIFIYYINPNFVTLFIAHFYFSQFSSMQFFFCSHDFLELLTKVILHRFLIIYLLHLSFFI